MAAPVFANAQYMDRDTALWSEYKRSPTTANLERLMTQFSGIINSQTNKWSGPLPRDVLRNEAKMLAMKAFDTYDPAAGASLATYLTNQLLPLSRIVYTYQNSARMPENITQKVNVYNSAVNDLKFTLGREPTTDELHSELGWTASEISRVRDYNHKELIESGPTVSSQFYSRQRDDADDLVIGAIYMELTPQEKALFECTTGYNGHKVLDNPAAMKKLGLSQAQLSYQKTKLKQKIESIMSRPNLKNRFGK